jgi:hypothetical protein
VATVVQLNTRSLDVNGIELPQDVHQEETFPDSAAFAIHGRLNRQKLVRVPRRGRKLLFSPGAFATFSCGNGYSFCAARNSAEQTYCRGSIQPARFRPMDVVETRDRRHS